MSVQLLDKTRKINKLLHNNNSSKVVFNDICAVLTEILDSNVLVVSKKGKILARTCSRFLSAGPPAQRRCRCPGSGFFGGLPRPTSP